MSVFKTAVVTPSRVRGAYRFLLNINTYQLNRTSLEESLSPRSLQPNANLDKGEHLDMVRAVIKEAIKMGLFEISEEENISISKQLLKQKISDEKLPLILTLLFSSRESNENEDLMRVIAWYLTLDPYNAPGTWNEANTALLSQIGNDMLGCNDARFGQFRDWIVFLGFGWRFSFKGENSRITPDPSKVVKLLFPQIFEKGNTISISDFIQSLATICPVFEGGRIRNELNHTYELESLPPKQLSKVTSFTLFRLQEEGLIKLASKSDAEVWFLSDGAKEYRCSEITWLGREE